MKAALLLVSAFILISKCLAESNTLWNDTATDRLRHDLLKNYDTSARPEHSTVASKVKIALTLIHIDLDETKGVLTTNGWLKINWTDSKLSWNPSDYENLASLHVAAGDVWQPDLTIYNSASANLIDHYGKTNAILFNNGQVLWVPPSKFETFCSFDFKYWPFDVQTCSIVIGSWTYSGHQIDLSMDEATPVDAMTNYFSSEWSILKTTAERHDKYYPCCTEPYVDITFNLTLQRVSPMYRAVALTPATLIVVMTLASFWLPPQSGEKILLNGITCVVICILLMYFSQLLPILAISPPLIVIFYSHTLYLLCISTIISVSVINLSRNKQQKALPRFIKVKILDGNVGKIFGNSITVDSNADELRDAPFEDIATSDDHQMIQVPTKNKSTAIHNEWIALAVIIDRITFFIYLMIFLLMGFFHFV
ncbi:unnamed protein product [Diamesa hyperborea]